MTTDEMRQEIMECMDALTGDQQRQVLDYARSLAGPPLKASGESLLRFVGTISREDLDIMDKAIEEAFEQVNPDEW